MAGCAYAAGTARRCAGDVISSLQLRKGVLQDMQEAEGRCSLTVHVPTRGLIGYKGVFTSLTRGEGLLNRAFLVRRSLPVLPHACGRTCAAGLLWSGPESAPCRAPRTR